MESFKNRLQIETENLFKETFPAKCEKFHKMLNEPMYSAAVIPEIEESVRQSCKLAREEIRTKEMEMKKDKDVFYTPVQSDSEFEDSNDSRRKLKRKFPVEVQDSLEDDLPEDVDSTQMDCNPHISKIIEAIKPEIRELTEYCNTVKTWVQLQIPEIQDGNNFGVEVQEEILEEVRKVEDDSSSFLKTLSIYHLTRAEIVSKFVKYPGVEDYVCALEQLDVKEFVTLRLMALELRNYCLSLLDLFDKNMEKILTPRGTNNSHMLVY